MMLALDAIQSGAQNRDEVAASTGLPRGNVAVYLVWLRQLGLIEKTGKTRTGPWRPMFTYRLKETA
jgi:DNA-binding IclR family transcriptional regulator